LKCLRFFEKYLAKTYLGSDVLEFYQKCECDMTSTGGDEFWELNEYLKKGRLPSDFIVLEEINSKVKAGKAKDEAFRYMEARFYAGFLGSEECEELKEVVRKEEIIVSRVRRTSLHRK